MVAMYWLICRLARGSSRWSKCVKYPCMIEKLYACFSGGVGSLLVSEFNSIAINNPVIVTKRVDIFSIGGIVVGFM